MADKMIDTQTIRDLMDPARAIALHATLGAPPPGETLPPFGHHIYFWAPEPKEALGRDGHPRVGRGLIPDLGLPQRMWAGGTLDLYAPIRLGVPAERVSRLENVDEKTGRTGRLGFVTLQHTISQRGVLCVTERQDLVYREPPDNRAKTPLPRARDDERASKRVSFDTTMLFRYSALTLNGHRIHYDADYAREVERYGGLVVHGPLLAQMLILFAEERLGPIRRFSFRATAPLMVFEPAELCLAEQGAMWVRGPDNRLCMSAEVR